MDKTVPMEHSYNFHTHHRPGIDKTVPIQLSYSFFILATDLACKKQCLCSIRTVSILPIDLSWTKPVPLQHSYSFHTYHRPGMDKTAYAASLLFPDSPQCVCRILIVSILTTELAWIKTVAVQHSQLPNTPTTLHWFKQCLSIILNFHTHERLGMDKISAYAASRSFQTQHSASAGFL